ncbi:MAG: Arginine deiminase [Candidatus Anoxychlamydiales bacterium]|nr:Arginine deiminase [Candidatus Anoxychlamydiales bacterium]
MLGKIKAEWDPLKKVVIHRPGMEMFFGLLEPYSSLYERPFSKSGAIREHEMLEMILKKEFQVEVLKLKDTFIDVAYREPKVKEALIEHAKNSIEYSGDKEAVERSKKEFDENAPFLDMEHFFNILLVKPTLNFEVAKGSRNIHLNITKKQTLANLFFMRDQQFMTDGGIVLCRMAKPSRRGEGVLLKFFWEKVMKTKLLHEIKEPGTIEGGEFIPFGKFALVGIGDRTNQDAIDQLLSLKMDYEEIGVVHQPMHPLVESDKPDPMINMHLDTYFNVASSNVVVGCEILIKNAMVDIYKNEGSKFKKTNDKITLYDYIKKKGFDVISVTTLEQMCYASNFLCIKDGQILAVESERNAKKVLNNLKNITKNDPKRYSKLLAQAEKDYEDLKNEGQFFPHKKEIYKLGIDAYPINIPNLTGGYGAAHCMTCALERGEG